MMVDNKQERFEEYLIAESLRLHMKEIIREIHDINTGTQKIDEEQRVDYVNSAISKVGHIQNILMRLDAKKKEEDSKWAKHQSIVS